jgi:hypothetical protein
MSAVTAQPDAFGPAGGPFQQSRRWSARWVGGASSVQRQSPEWLARVLVRVVALSEQQIVSPEAFERLFSWIGSVPAGVPEPFVAIGDDTSIGLEWSAGGNYLYVAFGPDDEGEMYFQGSNGDEWETTTAAGMDKMDAAFRSLATA